MARSLCVHCTHGFDRAIVLWRFTAISCFDDTRLKWVLHLRLLSWECGWEFLISLCMGRMHLLEV